jgi:hypothetical protein
MCISLSSDPKMPTRRERLSDADYVEQLRKDLRRDKWIRGMHAGIGMLTLVFCIWMIQALIDVLMGVGGPGQQNMALGVFGVAAALGFTAGFWLFQAAHSIARSFFQPRSDRMVVELWDALANHLRECPARPSLKSSDSVG